MSSLTDWQTRFPKIPQQGPFWCIPASVENLLKFAGLNSISQADMVLGYCKSFWDDALLQIVPEVPPRGVPVALRGRNDCEIMSLAQNCALRHANFQSISAVAEAHPEFQKSALSFKFIGNISDKAAYVSAIRGAMAEDEPALISLNNGNGTFHITAVLAIDGDELTIYDPARNGVFTGNVSNCTFSNDILVLGQKNRG